MEQEEILKRLEKIKFDKTRHKTIKEALKEIVESDKYSPAMRGIITDNKIMSELQDIIQAYKELQEVDSSEIEKVIEQLDIEEVEILEEEKEEIYTEVIVDNFLKNFFLKHKNKDTGEYEDIKTFTDLKLDINYFETKDGVYNYLGKKIFDKKEFDYKYISSISDKIIKLVKDAEKIIYISIDGLNRIDFKNYSELLFKNINTIFDGCNNKDKFFDYIINGKDLPYLEYEVVSIIDEYLYCVKDKEKCYFNLDGEKIISTEDYVYSDIIDMTKNVMSTYNKSHIVVVGGFDDKFNKVYGYYDLDEKRQITNLEYKEADNVASNFARVTDMNNNLKLLNIDDNKKIRVMDGKFLRRKSYYYLYKYHIYNYHIYYRNYLDDDIYEFVTLRDFKSICIMIVKDLNTSFKYLYDFECNTLNYYSNAFHYINNKYIFDGRHHPLRYYYYLDENYDDSKELTVSELFKNKKNNNLSKEYDNKRLLPILENSSFLLPIYKENKNTLMCLNDQEKNELVLKNIYELSNSTYIPKSKRIMNANNNDFDDNIIVDLGNMHGSLIYSEIRTKNGNKKCVLNFEDGICIQNDNFEIKYFDYLENIHIEVSYGNGEKQYLLDKLGNVILGPVDNISGPKNDIYIITNKGKMQIYQNGVPISYQADSISWVKKHYVDKNGISVKRKDLLKFRNGNNIYIVDEDGEKIIKQTEDALELQKMLFGLEFDDLLGIEEEKEKSYVKHK